MNEAVRDAYDRIAEAYASQRDAFKSLPYVERFAAMLPERGRVLDAGCGTGIPVTRRLVDCGFEVTGIDISSRMIQLARANVPEATFQVGDMAALQLAAEGAVLEGGEEGVEFV